MEKHQCKPITIYSQQTATNKSLDEKIGDYEAQYRGKDYTLPQDYEGDSACAPVVYGDGCCPNG
jgi:hypothetical protein